MWRLTIYQKKLTKYTAEGEVKTLETEESTVFEAEAIEGLLIITAKLSDLHTDTDTRFEIVKIKEEEK